MTEADLDKIITQGGRRIRLQYALQQALLTLGVTLLCVAASIFIGRYQAASALWIGASVSIIPLLTCAVFVWTYLRLQPSPTSVALALDTRANNTEHLTTWLELRLRDDAGLTPLQCDFKTAQRNATLQRGAAIQPTRCLPLSFPTWTRSIWLAVLLVLCALLMPAQAESGNGPRLLLNPDNRQALALQNSASGGGDNDDKNSAAIAPQIEPLSKTEMLMLKLQFSNEQLSPEAREKLLKDLETKIGDTPRNALPPDLQDILSTLQRESQARKTKDAASEQNADSAAQTLKKEDSTDPAKINPLMGRATIPETFEQAFTTIKDHYPDVKDELERYYRQQSKPAEPRRP